MISRRDLLLGATTRHLDSRLAPPRGTNWGFIEDPVLDGHFDAIRAGFEPEAQLAAIRRAHERFVDEALFLFVAHDVAPRALSPRVTGFTPAQNWYQDVSRVTMG